MTGIVTVSMISLIILGSLIRATPPCTLMSAGTRSSAMTAEAPASSAIRACVCSSVYSFGGIDLNDHVKVLHCTNLLSVDNVHNDATLQHAGEACLDGEVVLAILGAVAVGGGEFSCHCFWCV